MLISIFIVFFLIPLYFLPTFVAGHKRADKRVIVAVFIINLLSGWTGIGWIIALIVASASKPNNTH